MQDRATRTPYHRAIVGLLLLLPLVGCCFSKDSLGPPSRVKATIDSADPLHPEFENQIERGEPLLEVLISADRAVFPEIDPSAVRAAFESLASDATCLLQRECRGRTEPLSPEQAVRAFLATLRRRGFHYDLTPTPRGTPDSKVFSYTALVKSGCCTTFSLLCMAYLDRIKMASWVVCLPDHCFIRLDRSGQLADVESTDFDEPLRGISGIGTSPGPDGGASHYGRCLDRRQAVWHYFVDRLWAWIAGPDPDDYCLRALARASEILGSSCQSIEAQEAARHQAIACNDREQPERRRAAWAQSRTRFERLQQSHPEIHHYRANLRELARMAGDSTLGLDPNAGPSAFQSGR